MDTPMRLIYARLIVSGVLVATLLLGAVATRSPGANHGSAPSLGAIR